MNKPSNSRKPRRPSDRKASEGQKRYAQILAYQSGSASDIIKSESKYLTHAECAEMIPRLKKMVEENGVSEETPPSREETIRNIQRGGQ